MPTWGHTCWKNHVLYFKHQTKETITSSIRCVLLVTPQSSKISDLVCWSVGMLICWLKISDQHYNEKILILFLVKFHTTIIYYHVKLINKDKLEGGAPKVDGAKNRSQEQCKTMTTVWVATTRHHHTANHWNLKYFKHPVFNKIEDN